MTTDLTDGQRAAIEAIEANRAVAFRLAVTSQMSSIDKPSAVTFVDCILGGPPPTDLTAWLDEVQAKADAATAGPWETGWDGQEFYVAPAGTAGDVWTRVAEWTYAIHPGSGEEDECATENAAFIAAARTDVPALVAALRAVVRVIDEAVEDVTAAYTDTTRSEAGRQRSAMVRRVLMTLRDDTRAAITAAIEGAGR